MLEVPLKLLGGTKTFKRKRALADGISTPLNVNIFYLYICVTLQQN